jgi:hypothetical protein
MLHVSIDTDGMLISFLEVLITGKRVILQALSLEINIIITRNTKDYRNSKLSIMLPDDFIKTMNASQTSNSACRLQSSFSTQTA